MYLFPSPGKCGFLGLKKEEGEKILARVSVRCCSLGSEKQLCGEMLRTRLPLNTSATEGIH